MLKGKSSLLRIVTDKISTNATDGQGVTELETPRGRRIGFIFVMLAFGLIVGSVVAEIGLRIGGYSSPKFYIADEVLGHSLIPGLTGTFRKEGSSYVEINSNGFRDVEHSIEKPSNTFRIAVIGDSFVEAFQVEREEMFTQFLKDGLQSCGVFGDKQVELLSFGVAGYSTAQELLLFRDKVSVYHPDLVIVLITTNNDILDNVPMVVDEARPYLVRRDEKLLLDERFKDNPEYVSANSAINKIWLGIYNRVRVFQALGQGHRALMSKYKGWKERYREQEAQAKPLPIQPARAEIGVDNHIYLNPDEPQWDEAWQVTERLLLQFREEVRNTGADLLLVTGSNGVQVLPDPEGITKYAKQIGVEDLYYPENRLGNFGRANAIPLITLAPYLREYSETNNVFVHGFKDNLGYGHWNQLGHRIAGETIAKKICQGALSRSK